MFQHLKRRTKIQIVLIACIVLFLAIAVPLSAFINTRQVDGKVHSLDETRASYSPTSLPPDFVGLAVTVLSMETLTQLSNWRIDIVPYGTLRAGDGFATAINLTIGSQKIAVQPNTADIFVNFQQSVKQGLGFQNNYPLDNYTMAASFSASNSQGSLPIGFLEPKILQGWSIDSSVSDRSNGARVLTVNLTRSMTTILYSILILIIMWILSLTIFILSVTLWFRERKVEPPTIAVSAALLFALPAIRNTQPGAPTIGITADTAGFFWAMILVSCSTFLLMLNYIVKYKREKPKSPESKD
ncbi:hypothetical protein EDD86DRAFT_246655 [Gorgonomyces haynaldii]|nr:hypothetical protein EDD86DRAFT_246655 [Gorgonomyces haynaldii]